MPDSRHAVFLSYASQDAEAARRICEALTQAGVEVWFDQSELRGGDSWDQKIRRQIKDCALFVPVISANTQSRLEGYFRLEWRLAAQRTHTMADERAFLLPLVIDTTRDGDALVPAEFREVQWTRFSDGNPTEAFCTRVRALIGLEMGARASSPAHSLDRRATPALPATRSSPSTGLPAGKSIAVLAFANFSRDPENEYFSDGISEELLNVLAKVPGLRVTARTSSFYFKGRNLPVPEIAQNLGVIYIVEGSVRKAGNRVRITAQLIDAVEDTHLWSETFDRELKDIFAVQDEIAGLIAQNLQLKIGRAEHAAKPVNPEAYELCLLGRRSLLLMTEEALVRAEQLFAKALQIDPDIGRAAAGLAQISSSRLVMNGCAARFIIAELNETERRASEAIHRDPLLGDAYTVLGFVALKRGALADAAVAYDRAIALGASHEHLLASMLVQFRLRIGRPDQAIAEMERAYRADPLSWLPANLLGWALLHGGRLAEACDFFERAESAGASTATPAEHSVALAMLGRSEQAIERGRVAVGPVRKTGWSESFVAMTDAIAAWGLAMAGARSDAARIADRLGQGPRPLRWSAGYALLAMGELDDACALLADTPQDCIGPLMSLVHDSEPLRSDPRCLRLLEQLGASAEYQTLKRVRRGENIE